MYPGKQYDPQERHVHTLLFSSMGKAWLAHTQVQQFISVTSWRVRQGGERAFVVLDRPRPEETWEYAFTTIGPLKKSVISEIQIATNADEGQWNQL